MLRTKNVGIALVTGAIAGAVLLTPAGPATAAPGDWTQLSTFSAATTRPGMANTDEPTIATFGSQVQVIWSGSNAAGKAAYYSALLDGSGHLTTPQQPIIEGWDTLTGNPRLTTVGGQRFLFFSGLDATHSGPELYATSGDGLAWTVGPGSLSATSSAYAAYGNDGLDNAGTPVYAGQPGSVAGVVWHSGISPTSPAPAGSDGSFNLSGCCAYSAALARDPVTGIVWSAFYSNASGTSELGIQAGQILPTQGAFSQQPGSVTTNEYGTSSISPDQRVAMTARPGGGVFVAYGMGYPSLTGIRVHDLVSGRNLDVPVTARTGRLSLSADPAGRLWLVYAQDNRIKAVHTNPAATQFGAIGSWGAPAGTDTIWHTAASASAGGVDIAITSNKADGKINVWHTQAVRTLSIKGAPASVRRGHGVVFTVTDAGDPVAGATVKFAGHSATTNASGKATLTASGHGRKAATAKKSGYNTGATSVSVR